MSDQLLKVLKQIDSFVNDPTVSSVNSGIQGAQAINTVSVPGALSMLVPCAAKCLTILSMLVPCAAKCLTISN